MRSRQETARQVLYHFDLPGGYPAGSFFTYLYKAINVADAGNIAKLNLVYPNEVELMRLAMRDNSRNDLGIIKLKLIADGGEI